MLHEYVATGPRCAAERRLAGRSVRPLPGHRRRTLDRDGARHQHSAGPARV